MRHWQIKLSLFLNYFVFAQLLNSVGTVILLVQKSFLIKEGEAAVLEPFKDLSIAFVSFAVTSFITRIGYKKAMLTALAAVSVMCFIMPFTNSMLMVELLFATVGAGFALIKMSVYGTIGLVTNSEKEHLALMSFTESFFGIGIVAGYFTFPFFIDADNPSSTSWLNVYFLLGGLSLIAMLLLWFSPLDESSAKGQTESVDITALFKLLKKKVVLIFLVCAFLYVLLEQSIMSWLPTFNNSVLKMSEILSIRMASILAGSIALGRLLAGFIMQKIKWIWVLIVSVSCAAILILVAMPVIKDFRTTYSGSGISNLSEVPSVAFIFPLIGLLLAPIYPALNSVILSALPKPKHGMMAGLSILFSAVGGSVGSLITGAVFQHYGGETAFYFSLIPIIIFLISLLYFNRLLQTKKKDW
jgi:fucose permease